MIPTYKQLHTDERGTIFLIENLLDSNKEINISSTKKGYARGGCIHNMNNEYLVVIQGMIECQVSSDEKLTMKAGDSTVIFKGSPHYYIAITDCIVMEWGATSDEKKEKHLETRKIVDTWNKDNNNDSAI